MEKNYYIQGDPTRADKIKAAFKKLGINVLDFGFADKTVVYCSIGGCVQYLPYSINLMNILYTHPDYQELELSVKPKPKVGDWVVFNNNRNSIYQIGEIRDSYYKLTHTHGGSMPLPFSQGNFLRPWSIEDAKDGDVLAANECYVIFKEIDGLNIKCYCTYHYMGFNPSFHIDTLHNKTAFNPATKEQRDLLFKKIKEAGYEWDVDKKELKLLITNGGSFDTENCEQKLADKVEPKFKVGDDIKTGNTIETIAEVCHATRGYYCESGRTIFFENQDLWHLVPKPHYDNQELELPTKPNPKFKVGTWLWHKTKGVFPMMVEDYDEKEGYLMQYPQSKCYFGRDIIENDYRLWNFGDSKPGDILYDKAYNRIGIFENFGHHPDGGSFNDKTYCYLILYYDVDDNEFYEKTRNDMDGYDAVPATKEQRDLLFAKMKEAGYEWDADKKELKKVSKHYDISSFKPFDKVLVRDNDKYIWSVELFSFYRNKHSYPFRCTGNAYSQCIPFDGNEHLLGTTDRCDKRFINW